MKNILAFLFVLAGLSAFADTEPVSVVGIRCNANGVSSVAWAALPEGYTELKYIETSTDGPYIDTGYKPIATSDVWLKGYMPFEKTEQGRAWNFYWTRYNGNSQYPSFALLFRSATEIRAYKGSKGLSSAFVDELSDDIEYSTSGRQYVINGRPPTSFDDPFSSINYSLMPTLTIFGLNDGGAMLESQYCVSGARLSFFRITDGGEDSRVVRRDFVACRRESDKVVGLYDLSGQSAEPFYAPKQGAFIAGPDGPAFIRFEIRPIPPQRFDGVHPCTPKPIVFDSWTHEVLVEGRDYKVAGYVKNNWIGTASVQVVGLGVYESCSASVTFKISARLPKEYVPVEYLRSSCQEYIDTECTMGSGMKVAISFRLAEADCAGFYSSVFGARNVLSGATRTDMFALVGCKADAGQNHWSSVYGKQSKDITGEPPVAGMHYFTLTGTSWHLDEYTRTFEEEEFNSCNAYVFNLNSGGSPTANPAKMDLYSLTIWDKDGKQVRRFVPCRRVADGEAGLYDLRGKKFYGNKSGVGAFTAGPDVILPTQGLVLSIY